MHNTGAIVVDGVIPRLSQRIAETLQYLWNVKQSKRTYTMVNVFQNKCDCKWFMLYDICKNLTVLIILELQVENHCSLFTDSDF